MGSVETLTVQIPHELVQYCGWFLAFGSGLVVLSIAAIARSVTATVALMLFFGWLLAIGCGIELAQAVMVGHWAGFFYHLLAAILVALTGLLFVTRPMISAEVAAVVMAMFFMSGGLFQLIASLAVASPGRGWQVADGIITFALGALVLSAMACFRTLGDWPFRRDRSGFLRPRLDRAGAWDAHNVSTT